MSMHAAAVAVTGVVPAKFGDRTFERVTTDSRTIRERDLFVALKGERFVGHDFVAAALEQGAAGALVDEHLAGADSQACIAVREHNGVGQRRQSLTKTTKMMPAAMSPTTSAPRPIWGGIRDVAREGSPASSMPSPHEQPRGTTP